MYVNKKYSFLLGAQEQELSTKSQQKGFELGLTL